MQETVTTSIFCSKKLETFLGNLVNPEIENESTYLGNWLGRLFILNSKKYLLLTNEKTAFSIIFPDIKKTDLNNFTDKFKDCLVTQLRYDANLSKEQELFLFKSLVDINFKPSNNNRTIIGTMNEFVSVVRFDIEWKEENRISDLELSSKLNKYLVGTKLEMNKKKYFRPKDLMSELLNDIKINVKKNK